MNDALTMLFVRTDRLGEVLLNLPAIAALRAAYPGARITMLAHTDLEQLLRLVPEVDEVIPYEPGPRAAWWRRAWRMSHAWRAAAYDVAIISNPMRELHLAAYLAGIPQRIGYGRKWGGLLTHRLLDEKALGLRHEAQANMDLVRPLGVTADPPRWQFPPLPAQQCEARQWLKVEGLKADARVVIVHPWTSNPMKQWPLDRFQELIERLSEQLGVTVVVIGGKPEAALARHVMPPAGRVVNAIGRLTLPQLAGLLQCARWLISNDSGPVHLAAAAGARTVVIFGSAAPSTGPARWGPWGSGQVVVCKPSVLLISVEEVFEAFETAWAPSIRTAERLSVS